MSCMYGYINLWANISGSRKDREDTQHASECWTSQISKEKKILKIGAWVTELFHFLCSYSQCQCRKTINRTGPRTDPLDDWWEDLCPCRTDSVQNYLLNTMFCPVREPLEYFPENTMGLQLPNHMLKGTRSKARRKSIMITSYGTPLSNAVVTSFKYDKRFVAHDLPGRNPCWLGNKSSFSVRWRITSSLTMDSATLHGTEHKFIGR